MRTVTIVWIILKVFGSQAVERDPYMEALYNANLLTDSETLMFALFI